MNLRDVCDEVIYRVLTKEKRVKPTETPAVPTPPVLTSVPGLNTYANEPLPLPAPTLIESLSAKLHAAHLDLDAAEQRVKDLETEIESLPAWAKELTAEELAARIDGWFK